VTITKVTTIILSKYGRFLGPPNPLYFIISSARKRKRELILKSLFKKLGQHHPHCRGVAPTEISGPSEQKSRCYLA